MTSCTRACEAMREAAVLEAHKHSVTAPTLAAFNSCNSIAAAIRALPLPSLPPSESGWRADMAAGIDGEMIEAVFLIADVPTHSEEPGSSADPQWDDLIFAARAIRSRVRRPPPPSTKEPTS